ncbi:MAG: methyl-accepting chemotaxis protein, partial [Gammaproteobacteria bacterium]|nr:methyl-accepting chemotaxis protein [Gammaproteobacteria bacterium]
KNFPVTNTEQTFAGELRIISTTDEKGITTYANSDFIEISGFSEDELYGKSHNIVRHPDMPPEAFANLWDTIKQGKPWMGIVKNRCKNGDHYWVDAYVTPVYQSGKVVGYQSVRTTPDRTHVNRASAFYKKIVAGKSSASRFLGWVTGKLKVKLMLSNMASLFSAFIVLQAMGGTSNSAAITTALVTGISVAGILSFIIARPWENAAKRSKEIFDNGIANQVYTGRTDELGQIETSIYALQAKLKTVLVRVSDAVNKLNTTAHESMGVINESFAHADEQLIEVEKVATAMNELSSTVHEVANSAEQTAEQTHNANDEAKDGALKAVEALGGMEVLVQEIETTAGVIHALKEESTEISSVVDVIQSIAEQTNLLALNAAIEAARAGEQGRGFAVVADEVRTLASRTQHSTGEIQKIVEKLLKRSNEASEMMSHACDQGNKGSELVELAAEALAEVAGAVSSIDSMNTQVATATEEQSMVAEEVNRSVTNISDIANETLKSAEIAKQAGEVLADETEKLRTTVWQFEA